MGLKTAGEKLCFKGGLFSATVHVALHTAEPEAGNELTGGGYARVAIATAGWTIDAATGQASNADDIVFPVPSAAWGDPTHVGLWSAATGGDLLASAALGEDVSAPQPGNEVLVRTGEVTFDLATDD